MELAETPRGRQKEYRKLFAEYLSDSREFGRNLYKPFIGSSTWVIEQLIVLKRMSVENEMLQLSAGDSS